MEFRDLMMTAAVVLFFNEIARLILLLGNFLVLTFYTNYKVLFNTTVLPTFKVLIVLKASLYKSIFKNCFMYHIQEGRRALNF